MAERTEISWAHSTFNPWIGCTNVSPGCDHCYAEALDHRWGHDRWGPGKPRQRTSEANWREPLKWERKAVASNLPWRVFCASLADVFDNEVPAEWRVDLFYLIRATPSLTWMLLTKRIGNVPSMVRSLPPNVWLGITVVNQEEADRDIPKLLKLGAATRWLSCEPLLGPLDLRRYLEGHEEHGLDERMKPGACIAYTPPVDWVIVGGESGAQAREINPEWVRSLRDQCAAADVAFHFKQWGGIRPKSRGHLLDGVEYRAFPDSMFTTNNVTEKP